MRLDKYLKVSRIIKRRTVANDACDGALVTVNGKAADSYDFHDEKDKKSCANTNPYYLPVQKALYYIRAHFKEDITLKSVSEFAGIPTATLSKKFPEHLGFGFKEYLVDLRLDYAKMLITNTNEQITDIAFYSGFNSLSYFQRVFMEKYGITPKNYRRENASAASNM
jgi:AraC-like DNA-binding protein